MADSISAKQRLVVTLRFLATGNSYQDLKYSSLISQPMLSIIIPETCSAIYTCLEHYIKIFLFFLPKIKKSFIMSPLPSISRDPSIVSSNVVECGGGDGI
ncbi:hypothetical protein HW555_009982 [Spodoptera exigua]|uniref:Uncharacterized protein n=1 Tax=Spodoptera exigua TaxID=7107 RepID=A0A835GA78_SPOEX|nr:hypothetical protein HW555_009982 [Spodoptera exigua]